MLFSSFFVLHVDDTVQLTLLLDKLISKRAHQKSSRKLFGTWATRGSWSDAVRVTCSCQVCSVESARCADCVKELSQWGLRSVRAVAWLSRTLNQHVHSTAPQTSPQHCSQLSQQATCYSLLQLRAYKVCLVSDASTGTHYRINYIACLWLTNILSVDATHRHTHTHTHTQKT